MIATPSLALAQVTAPSTYANNIMVQGEAEGTEFNDWASIPIAYSDAADNPGDNAGRPYIDIANIQIANDDEFLFIRATFHNTSSKEQIFIGLDTDLNSATGWNILELGMLGSEVGYQNDFVFQQHLTAYNMYLSLTGGPLTNGGALIYPYWDQDGSSKEWAIPRNLGLGYPAGAPGFPQDTIRFALYTEEGGADITDQTITYTFAEAPSLGGDYNGDGTVDAADFTVWRDLEGSIGMNLAADGTGDDLLGEPDGDVDSFDYQLWKADFGGTSGGLAAGGTVPEPMSAMLLATGAVAALTMRSRRRV